MNILITGGAGFIGSHLAEKLLSEGHAVTVLDNLSSGKIDNLNTVKKNPLFSFLEKDIREISETDLTNVDAVVHLAAIANVQKSIEAPIETHDINVNGTLYILEACKKAGVKKIIFASSAAVYGDAKELPIKESLPLHPNTPYGLHKLIGEQYARLYTDLFGLQAICFRFFNVYGARQNNTGYAGLIAALYKSILMGEIFSKFGDGEQTRDFIHVSDIVSAIALSLNQEDSFTCNLGTGQTISVNDAIQQAEQVFNKKINLAEKPARNEIKHSCANIDLAKSKLNWEPKITFSEGLKLL